MKHVPLSIACDVIMGQAPSGDTYNTDGNGMPLIAGASDFGDLAPSVLRFTTSPGKTSQPGDILLCIRATIGDLNWSDRTYCLGRGVAAIRVRPELADSRFICRLLERNADRLAALGRGATFKQITRRDIDDFEVFLPPLDVQKRIAAILDQADSLRRLRQRTIERLNDLEFAVFDEMFGDPAINPLKWDTWELGQLIAIGPQNGLYKPASEYGSGTPILRIDAFYDGVVTKLDTLKRVRVSDQERNVYALNEDDIVVNRVNSLDYLGKSALIPRLAEPTIFESNMMRFAVNRDLVHPAYVVRFLQTVFAKQQILRVAKNAVNQSSINQSDVQSFEIRVPPLPLQHTFHERLKYIQSQARMHSESLQGTERLFSSLQHCAFRGELQ